MRWFITGVILSCSACAAAGTGAGEPFRSDGGSDPQTPADAGPTPSFDGSPETDAGDSGGPIASQPTRLLSVNLQCLLLDETPFATQAERVEAIAARVVSREITVLLLQEVCSTDSFDMLTALEAALETESGAAWSSAYAFAHVAWEGTPNQANEGVAILARAESLTDIEAFVHQTQGSLQRATVGAMLPDGRQVWSVHFDHEEEAVRLAQAREIAVLAMLGASNEVVVGGDLNATAEEASYQALVQAGFLPTPGLPADGIDHIFVHRGAAVIGSSAEQLWTAQSERVSDHPAVFVELMPQVAAGEVVRTMLVARIDVGFGHTLSIRGDHAPLDWNDGWPLINRGTDEWRFASTELAGSFEYKYLVDDLTWEAGDNRLAEAGETAEVTPSF